MSAHIATAMQPATPIRAAAYVRMSTERQVYSTANQMDAIEKYAVAKNLEVVAVYEDAGKSGLTKRGRPGLSRLIDDVQASHGFSLILVYDVSRWGRFQDIDESAYYEHLCRLNGVNVAYCAEVFENDGSPYAAIIKALKRVAAADYSRELSTKVFAAQCRMVRLGYKTGGPAGYGLRRRLLDEHGKVIGELANGEWKAVQTHRVVLIPGPPFEVAVVNQIFQWYIDGIGDRKIAAVLNQQNVPSERGGPWTPDIIRGMIRNEKYLGHLVFNRRSYKLKRQAVKNPVDLWVRCNDAFPRIVPEEVFKAAQRERARRYRRYSKAELLDVLKGVYRDHGRVSSTLIDQHPDGPTARLVARHFGTLYEAYSQAGIPTERNNSFLKTRALAYAMRANLVSQIEVLVLAAGGRTERTVAPYSIRINGMVTLSVRVIRCGHEMPHNYYRWRLPATMAENADFVLAAQLDKTNREIIRYFLLSADVFAAGNVAFTERSIDPLLQYSSEWLGAFFGIPTGSLNA